MQATHAVNNIDKLISFFELISKQWVTAVDDWGCKLPGVALHLRV